LVRESTGGIRLNKNWAPRLGFVGHSDTTGKRQVYANYGRFYENIPQDINIRALRRRGPPRSPKLSPDPANTTVLTPRRARVRCSAVRAAGRSQPEMAIFLFFFFFGTSTSTSLVPNMK